MSHLSLFSCGGTRIGDVDKRGISGGERKRVSIGCELLVNPSVLFVDVSDVRLCLVVVVLVVVDIRMVLPTTSVAASTRYHHHPPSLLYYSSSLGTRRTLFTTSYYY